MARTGYEQYRRDFVKLIWKIASPKWSFDDATFDRSAMAFDNPDHVDIVIHNYRWRLSAEGDANGAPHLDASVYARKFSGRYVLRSGIGHNLPQDASRAFADAIVEVASYDLHR